MCNIVVVTVYYTRYDVAALVCLRMAVWATCGRPPPRFSALPFFRSHSAVCALSSGLFPLLIRQ